ncbi:ThuA domain-containing protein [Luteolibacter marinus]|uniref:ThuA domain-containing protein n=1 Tax=Luteolibacter marinus TaxID=2776705 RepID=UPI001D003C04|nr:ThuA domain-containing protein [Luteolibacter marinus]
MLAFACSPLLPAAPIKVLVIEGASNHDWQHRIEIVRAILSRDGSFDVDFSVTPGPATDPGWTTWSPDFAAYNVVMSGYSNHEGGEPRWPAAVEANFAAYVSGGGGFVAFHEAAQSFVDWPEYNEMLGIRWNDASVGTAVEIDAGGNLLSYGPDLPGPAAYTSHGPHADTLVTSFQNHPIHAGLPASWMAANLEIWRYLRGPANNLTVLSYAKDAETQLQFPVEWAVNYGAGRVYGSSYGHLYDFEDEPVGMRCAAFQETLVRALKWCAGVTPPATVPADFPTPTTTTVRAHAEGFSGFGGPQPVGPFSNGVLPTLSIVPTGVELSEAFPALDWESPIDAKPWPEQPGQLMIAEMDGRIFKVADDDAATTRELVLDVRNVVWYLNWDQGVDPGAPGQPDKIHKHGGILSTAFHPQFGKGLGKDFLYIYYLHNPNDDAPAANPPFYDRLARYTWNGTAFVSPQILINQYDTVKGHEGGGMCFGADGFLYLAVGDEGNESGDAEADTQKIDDRFRSGVWRIDVDMQGGAISHPIRRLPAGPGSYTQNYFIPSDNPWVVAPEIAESPVLEEFYAIGLREPHRMSFDAATGLFWIGDVGASAREEVDVMDGPGLNFEWSYKEGTNPGFADPPAVPIGTDRAPVHDYEHGVGNCIIGGYVYRGTAIPELVGKYLYGDNGSQLLYALEYDPQTQQTLSVEQFGQGRAAGIWEGISSFGIDSAGEPLLLQLGAGVNGNAVISRIKPAGPPAPGTWTYPALLSETGVFADVPTLTPAPAMIPYDVNMPLWSAGMEKKRWVMIPNDGVADSPAEQITYSQSGNWQFPVGTVFVKHFARPDTGAPLETRLLVHGTDGWGGVTYKWRADGSEADLLEEGAEEVLTVGSDTFEYLYPSRSQCNQCHTPVSGPVLGFRTRQLNRIFDYPGGSPANQIESLSVAGFIPQSITVDKLAGVLTSTPHDDPVASDEDWVRSYFDSNCSHCHQPGGSSRAFFDARLSTPLPSQSIICGPVIDGLGAPAPAVIKPGSIENSVLLQRINTIDECCSMPPLAKGIVDDVAVARVADWILGMNADSCTKTGSFYGGGFLGSTPSPGPDPELDLWHSNLVVNEAATFTNPTAGPLVLTLDRFRFNAGIAGDPLTPFVVRVNADNDFTVLAIGSTRVTYVPGANDLPFSDSPATVTVGAGETIAVGFLDALPDGSGGTGAGVITWQAGGAEVWHSGGPLDGDSASLTIGQPPVPGASVVTIETRDYDFAVTYQVGEFELGDGLDVAPDAISDGAYSNFVINETDVFTNNTPHSMNVSVQRFRFHAALQGDPVTPFVVRVNADNDFTVLAIGTTRTSYALGDNNVAFSDSPVSVILAPGETLATGFLDALPDGTGGTGPGVVSFDYYGTDEVYYSYNIGNTGSSIAVGQAPVTEGVLVTDTPRSYYYSISLAVAGGADAGSPELWAANLVIDKQATFTNTSGAGLTLLMDRFQFNAAGTGEPLTPFIVRVDGPNSFTVLAVGNPRTGYASGQNDLPFSDASTKVEVAAGETIAIGFLDANPDGSGGTQPGIVVSQPDMAGVWHGGGPAESDSGSVTAGQPPAAGAFLVENDLRHYDFSISYLVVEYQLGNGPAVVPGYVADQVISNLVINESDVFTNNTAQAMTVTVDRFRFHASSNADPLTPFLVRVNADNDFTVLAIGTTRTAYALGVNDLPFSEAPAQITVAPGETIAPGFLDAYPDGSGGTGDGVISFNYFGTDEIFYSYDITPVASTIALGEAPVPKGYQHTDFTRDYFFSVSLGFGGKEDEDGDGLPDKWELAWFPDLTTLSGLADADGDGMSDAAEFESGTDPTDPASVLRATSLLPAPGAGGASAAVQTVPGRYYEIGLSSDLDGWVPTGPWKAASWPAATTVFPIPAASLPPGADRKLFIRVTPASGN